MTKAAFLQLVDKYLAGQANLEEEQLLLNFFESFHEEGEWDTAVLGIREELEQKMLDRLTLAIRPKPTRSISWYRIAAAAVILLTVSLSAYFLVFKTTRPIQVAALAPENMKPMNKGIILTTGSGQQIVLTKTPKATVNTNDGSKAQQSESGLVYQPSDQEAVPVMHTLTNNTGSKYTLELADGTTVYLDAVSSISYPVAFKGKERRVTITGQAYFKVKHDANRPFRVAVKDELVEDIGTEFNINAYESEAALKTTLIEGAVKVNRNNSSLLLKPGHQAITNVDGLEDRIANIEETTAWLQGKLIFDNETLENIMNRVARIYDIKVIWLDDSARKLRFGGSFNYSKKLASVLNFYRGTGKVDFIVEGKTVKVFKKKTTAPMDQK